MPKALVVGSPIDHSLSPALHRAGYVAAGLADWEYDKARVEADQLADFVKTLPVQVRGISVTMPDKEVALEVADDVSALAREVGAANTLVRRGEKWFADNTDVAGVLHALLDAGCASARSAVIVGSGATARAVVAAIAQLGVLEVTFIVRSTARSETVALARSYEMDVRELREDALDEVALADSLGSTRLLVSTAPAGGGERLASLLASAPQETGSGQQFVFDVVYANWPTPLARSAQARGARVVSGLDMLVHQAAVQFELFTGHSAPISDMMAAGLAAMEG